MDDLRKTRPELAEQVHVFNSFFYKKLVGKRKCVPRLRLLSGRVVDLGARVALTYESVRKWTSKVDIFNKKYIIVPINEKYAFIHPFTKLAIHTRSEQLSLVLGDYREP